MAAFSLLSLLLVGRLIGPAAMGAATTALAGFLILDVLAASLFTDALVQHPTAGPRHAGSALTAGTLAGGAAALLLAGLGPLLAAGSGVPEVAPLTWALAPLLPLSAWSGAMAGLVLREHRFALLAARALLGQPLALAVGLAVAEAGGGAWAMIANQAAATLATFVLLLALAGSRGWPRLDRSALRDLWPVAGPQIAAVAVLVGKYRMFLLALGFTAGQSAMALSHVAFRLLDGVLVIVFQSISRIALPRLCAEARGATPAERHRLAEAFGDIAQLHALLGLPLAVGTALVAPAMVQGLLGPEWAAAAAATQVVGFAAAAGFLNGDVGSLFVALGKARWNLVAALVGLVLPLVLLAVLRPQTPAAVAWCWASQSLLLPPVLAWLSLREIGRAPLWLLRRTAPALMATAAMAAAVLLVQALPALRPLTELMVSAVVGAAVYAAVAAAALGLRLPAGLLPRLMAAA